MVHVPLPPEKVHHGGAFRTLLLVLSIASVLGSMAGLIGVAAGGVQEDNSLGPSPLPRRIMILAFCGLLNVGFTTGVWGWRRWGVYGIVCVSLFAFMVNFRIGGAWIAVPGLIAPGLLAVVAAFSWAELD